MADPQYLLQEMVRDTLLGLGLFALIEVCQQTSSTGKQWLCSGDGQLDLLPTAAGTEVKKL